MLLFDDLLKQRKESKQAALSADKPPVPLADNADKGSSSKHALMLELEQLAQADGFRDMPLEAKVNRATQAILDYKANLGEVVTTKEAVPVDFLTASRLVATDGSKNLASSDLASWVTGGAGITVTDNGDGTITISLT